MQSRQSYCNKRVQFFGPFCRGTMCITRQKWNNNDCSWPGEHSPVRRRCVPVLISVTSTADPFASHVHLHRNAHSDTTRFSQLVTGSCEQNAVAVLGWGQGGTGPPNLAQAPQIFDFFRSAYCALFLLEGFWGPEICLECVGGRGFAPDPAAPRTPLGELTTLPQIP